MGVLSLEYRQTRARAGFKRRSGHTTQHLLTLVVGVDAVRNGARATDSLPATWNPRNAEDAADRARVFALNAALLWNAESVISYVQDLTRSIPRTLSEALIEDIRKVEDKEEKLVLLCERMTVTELDALALVRAGYVWRNRVTHYAATNKIKDLVASHLATNAERINDEYQGLEVEQLVGRIHRGESPRLKETAAMVRAASRLVREIDRRVVSECGTLNYLRAGLAAHLSNRNVGTPGAKAASLWGGTESQNRRSLENFGVQISLSRDDQASLDDEGLAALSPTDAVDELVQDGTS